MNDSFKFFKLKMEINKSFQLYIFVTIGVDIIAAAYYHGFEVFSECIFTPRGRKTLSTFRHILELQEEW